MSNEARISGRMVTAGRMLAGVSPEDFAGAAGIEPAALAAIERGGSTFVAPSEAVAALLRALDHYGIVVIEEAQGMGAGVRLKFTRQDVRQIARLEGEGGQVRSDDRP